MRLATFRSAVSAALLSGLGAGLLLTAVQQLDIFPIIQEAERYEQAAAGAAPATSTPAALPPGAQEHTHTHPHAGDWVPETAAQRLAGTAAANVALAVGFALLLSSVMTLRTEQSNWRRGMLWGLAGYAVFFAAPSLGLPPEIPGTESAPVAVRQLWWLGTSAATAVALVLLCWVPRWPAKLAAIALAAIPHVIGARHCCRRRAAPLRLVSRTRSSWQRPARTRSCG